MSTMKDDAFQDGSREATADEVKRLQELVCHLLRHNEELRETVRILTPPRPRTLPRQKGAQ